MPLLLQPRVNTPMYTHTLTLFQKQKTQAHFNQRAAQLQLECSNIQCCDDALPPCSNPRTAQHMLPANTGMAHGKLQKHTISAAAAAENVTHYGGPASWLSNCLCLFAKPKSVKQNIKPADHPIRSALAAHTAARSSILLMQG